MIGSFANSSVVSVRVLISCMAILFSVPEIIEGFSKSLVSLSQPNTLLLSTDNFVSSFMVG
jgi:hypothetical protein